MSLKNKNNPLGQRVPSDQVGATNPEFKHGQSAQLVDEIKDRAKEESAMPISTAGTITKDELRDKIDSGARIQILNVLAPEEHSRGSIPGSLMIPLEDLDRRMSELDKAKDIITYCANTHCTASRMAAEKLAANGFRVRAYEGGIDEWKTAGFPTDQAQTEEQTSEEPGSRPQK